MHLSLGFVPLLFGEKSLKNSLVRFIYFKIGS
jgi:hypothetical protein